MVFYNTTLDALIEKVCRIGLQDWAEGTATATAAGSVTDTNNRKETDDYWNDLYAKIHIRSGAAKGNTRRVSDFVNSSSVISVTPNFSATPAIGDSYSLHYKFEWEDVVEAINTAILDIARDALFHAVDEETLLLASVNEYYIPDEFAYINRIIESNADGQFETDAEEIDPASYSIIFTDAPKIRFEQFPTAAQFTDHDFTELWQPTADRKLRIEGLKHPVALVVDTDATPIDPMYLVHQASALLWVTKVRRAESDPEAAEAKARFNQDRADRLRGALTKIRLPINSKKVSE